MAIHLETILMDITPFRFLVPQRLQASLGYFFGVFDSGTWSNGAPWAHLQAYMQQASGNRKVVATGFGLGGPYAELAAASLGLRAVTLDSPGASMAAVK